MLALTQDRLFCHNKNIESRRHRSTSRFRVTGAYPAEIKPFHLGGFCNHGAGVQSAGLRAPGRTASRERPTRPTVVRRGPPAAAAEHGRSGGRASAAAVLSELLPAAGRPRCRAAAEAHQPVPFHSGRAGSVVQRQFHWRFLLPPSTPPGGPRRTLDAHRCWTVRQTRRAKRNFLGPSATCAGGPRGTIRHVLLCMHA